MNNDVSRVSYFGVFDGHNGARASKHCALHLHETLAEKLLKGSNETLEKEMKRCFVETFKKTDEDFINHARRQKPSWKDGTTATVLLFVNNTLYIANVGDSKAILCRQGENDKLSAVTLTKDHEPTAYEERMRIQKAGGSVRDGRVLGSLEVSRSIGDGQYKRCGVSCVPDIRRCVLSCHDRFVVLACDGLWKVCQPDEVVRIVDEALKDTSLQAVEGAKSTLEVRCEAACHRLAMEAVRKLSGDNVTVLLIHIGELR